MIVNDIYIYIYIYIYFTLILFVDDPILLPEHILLKKAKSGLCVKLAYVLLEALHVALLVFRAAAVRHLGLVVRVVRLTVFHTLLILRIGLGLDALVIFIAVAVAVAVVVVEFFVLHRFDYTLFVSFASTQTVGVASLLVNFGLQ